MQLKRDKLKIIIVDVKTYRNGFAVDLEELLGLIEDSSAEFYHAADEDLLPASGFPPGRSNLVNAAGRTQWRTKNAQYRNLYLIFRSIRHKKPNPSQGK